MARRISCCLNIPLPTKSLSPLLKTTSQISWTKTEDHKKAPRRSKCSLVLGVAATVVISTIQISDVASVEATVMESPVEYVGAAPAPPRRWSDKRTCPPWLENSLKTIVPENLPRPSAHRRLELAGMVKADAPPVGAVVIRGNRAACFSV